MTEQKRENTGKRNRTKVEHVSTYKQRFDSHYEEMKSLYYEIYNGDSQAFEYFCSMLREYHRKRPVTLKRLDSKRLREVEWFKDRSILGVQFYVDCFAGDLRGIMSKLDYLKDFGVRYMHIMPLLTAPAGANDGGYAVANFRRIQRGVGSLKDFFLLTEMCHENDIAVCLDFVLNHTSDRHEWALRAKRGEKEYMDRYFMFDGWDIPNEYERSMQEVFPQTSPGNFSWCEEAGKVVMTTFHDYQWDLNYRNPTVFNDMTANMLNLCNRGVDIIRLDAIPYIWKAVGTSCRNCSEVHKLVRLLRIAAEIAAPGVMLLGEVVMEPDKVTPYFGSAGRPECHMLYNVITMATTWHTVATRDVRLMRHQLESAFALPKQFIFLNYLRCHDDIGWGLDYDFLRRFGTEEIPHKRFLNDYMRGARDGSPFRGELYNDDPVHGDARLCGTTASLCGIESAEYELNQEKLQRAIDLDIMLHAFLLTLSGIPIIYSGDEIGMTNDYSYKDDPFKSSDSRYVHRGRFRWDEAELRHDLTTRPERIFTALRALMNAREKNVAFSHRADVWVIDTQNDCVLGVGRYCDGEKLVALFNFADGDRTAVIPTVPEDDEFTDLFSGDKLVPGELLMHGHEFRWLTKEYD